MFWPVHQWDEHGVLCENCRNLHILSLKDSVEGRAATSQQSSIINSQRNFCLCLPKERKEGKWWVARKGNAFIGIHCTQSVKASTAGNPQPVLPIANIKIKADWHVIERCAPPHVAISKDTSKLTAEEEEVLKGQEDVIEEDISDSQVVLEDETEDIEPIEDRFGRILPVQVLLYG